MGNEIFTEIIWVCKVVEDINLRFEDINTCSPRIHQYPVVPQRWVKTCEPFPHP